MREIEFKMERQDLVKTGDEVEIIEREGVTYSYIIEPAVSMSGCFPSRHLTNSRNGFIN